MLLPVMIKEHERNRKISLLQNSDEEKDDKNKGCSEKVVLNDPFTDSSSSVSRPLPRFHDPSYWEIDNEFEQSSFDVYDTVDHFTEVCYLIRDSFFGTKKSVIAHYIPLVSVLQYGSRCGFVALSMASQMFRPVGARKLFEEAKNLGLTSIGEMFDAYEMANFAADQLQCESKVICDLPSRKYEILSHICDGWPALIPYDQYGSYPGQHQGERAHWAVLNGLFFSVNQTVDPNRKLRFISKSRGAYVKERLLYDCRTCSPDSEIFVIAREGTREQLLAWRLDSIIASNMNLFKISAKFGLERDYDLSNLRNKAVLLKKSE